MKKRILSVLLAAAICSALLSGCGKNKKDSPKEDVTLIIKAPELALNSVTRPEIAESGMFLQMAGEAFADQYEAANVTIRIEAFDYIDEMEAITGCFDTDDATDILYEGYFNMASYLHTGRVVPLDDIISDELRNDIDDAYWAMSMADGKTYMMPFLSMQNILIYNKELFRECGLDAYLTDDTIIQNWTLEDWNTILDTLAANLPDRTYPIMMYGKNNQGDTHIMSFLRSYGSTIFDSEGNFDFEDERVIEALTWLQNGVDRGWYPPHPENLEIADCNELFLNGQLAISLFNNASFTLYDDIGEYGFVNFPGDVATSFITGFEIFDNGDALKVQAAKDFVRFLYENEEWLELSAGNIPASSAVAEKYQDQISMLNEFTANSVHVVDFMNNSPNWQGSDTSVRNVFWPQIRALLAMEITPKECASALNRDCNAALKIGRQNSTLHE
ncbi:MAG: extracellular solute-binding protein [Lachnospiraceae bacterium]|nr:extracellular solute-binding protein [Lachnospiraceae bacterium]MDE7238152.1 extracellular solute-binding protein [Lachnospiraceae bacterium]